MYEVYIMMMHFVSTWLSQTQVDIYMSQGTLTRKMQQEAESAATQALSQFVRVGQEDVNPQVYHQL